MTFAADEPAPYYWIGEALHLNGPSLTQAQSLLGRITPRDGVWGYVLVGDGGELLDWYPVGSYARARAALERVVLERQALP